MKKFLIVIGIIISAFIIERILSFTPLFEQLELITYDFRAKISSDSGPFHDKFKPADKNIVIVAVDDYSRKELTNYPKKAPGAWPWPRDTWGGVVNFIEKGQPRAILFDLIFNDLNTNPWNDRRLAQTLRQYDNIVLATSLNDPKNLVDKLNKKTDIANPDEDFLATSTPLNISKVDDKNLDDAITYYSHAPVHGIYTEHNTMGVVNKVVDRDSVIRMSQPIFKLTKTNEKTGEQESYYMPSLAFAGFLKYYGEDGNIYIKNNKIYYKDKVIPINNYGEVNLNWHGSGNDYPYVSISKILLSEKNDEYIKPDYFKDKIVIIGRTEAGTDIHRASVSPSYPGPEANATAIDNFINDTGNANSRKFVTQLSFLNEYLIIIFCCILIGIIGLKSKNAFLGFINSSLFIILYILASVIIFANPTTRIWLPIVVPLYYMLLTSGIVYAFKLEKETSKKTEIMNIFGKFVSPSVLDKLVNNADKLELKNARKPVTVMFCDVKSFTSMSEKCSPEKLMESLNEFFNEAVNIIFENNGTVDKFIGDCIMAYWGDPIATENDAYLAVKSALEIKKKVNELKIHNVKENKLALDVKIGINTGTALLGLAGSERLMSYTAMGDAVNVASRLEGSCLALNRDILISKATYEAAKSKIVVLEAGTVNLKGKSDSTEVFEPIGLEDSNKEEK